MIKLGYQQTAYTLQANAPALRNIASFDHNVVYAGNVIQNSPYEEGKTMAIGGISCLQQF